MGLGVRKNKNNPNMNQGMNPNMNPGMNPNMNMNMNSGMNPNMNMQGPNYSFGGPDMNGNMGNPDGNGKRGKQPKVKKEKLKNVSTHTKELLNGVKNTTKKLHLLL